MSFSLKRVFAVVKARDREFYRDFGTLGWAFAFPFLLLIGFNYMFNLDEEGLYKAGYVGLKPETEAPLVTWIEFEDKEIAEAKLKFHKIDLLLLREGDEWIAKINESSLRSKTAGEIWRASLATSEVRMESLRGDKVSYVDWLFPGLIALNVSWMALWGVGWVIVRHRKLGVLKRFQASPMKPLEYLLGQMISRLVILMMTGVVLFAGGMMIHPLTMQGSVFDLFVFYMLGCISLSGIGMVIAARISSEELVNGVLNLMLYPMMFLSEIWFSLDGAEKWVLVAAKFIPLWHLTDGMRKIMFEGYNLLQLSESVAIFIALSIAGIGIGTLRFRWH